jgi:hypothetical protein
MGDSIHIETTHTRTTGLRMGRARAFALSTLVCGALALAPGAALAESDGFGSKAGLGVGSAFATLVYAPVKLCYAVGGLVVGGLAWAFSGGDSNVAKVVLTPSVLGDYVVTPDNLRGNEPLEFFGRDPAYEPRTVDVAASPEPMGDEAW